MRFLFLLLFSWNCFAAESAEFAEKVIREHELSPERAKQVRQLLMGDRGLTRNIGTEDLDVIHGPNNSWHMASRRSCIEKVIKSGAIQRNPRFEKICNAKWMAPISEKVCMDQFEFPDIPCEYPVVWTTSSTAKQVCEAMGKRVCNSHEWEGACAGKPRTTSSYLFGSGERGARRALHNQSRLKVWAYQFQQELSQLTDSREVCGVYSPNDKEMAEPMRSNPSAYFTALGKSLSCQRGPGSDYQTCGTNSWPSGFKQYCKSEFEIYDMHGNLAEVTNLPETISQVADGQGQIGGTERKGSFFVYRSDYPDDCYVRQPYEHYGNYATDHMAYYQEGFRCCKDISP